MTDDHNIDSSIIEETIKKMGDYFKISDFKVKSISGEKYYIVDKRYSFLHNNIFDIQGCAVGRYFEHEIVPWYFNSFKIIVGRNLPIGKNCRVGSPVYLEVYNVLPSKSCGYYWIKHNSIAVGFKYIEKEFIGNKFILNTNIFLDTINDEFFNTIVNICLEFNINTDDALINNCTNFAKYMCEYYFKSYDYQLLGLDHWDKIRGKYRYNDSTVYEIDGVDLRVILRLKLDVHPHIKINFSQKLTMCNFNKLHTYCSYYENYPGSMVYIVTFHPENIVFFLNIDKDNNLYISHIMRLIHNKKFLEYIFELFERFKIELGITLCPDLHKLIHSMYKSCCNDDFDSIIIFPNNGN